MYNRAHAGRPVLAQLLLRVFAVLLGCTVGGVTLTDPAAAATISVTTVDDNGNDAAPTAGSLRAAIVQANASIGVPDIIDFSIATEGSPQRISPPVALPAVTDPLTIDGWTQGPNGYEGPPLIELRGNSSTPGVNGLTIHAAFTTVRGLMINRFLGDAIFTDAANTTVLGCYLGAYEDTVTTANFNSGRGVAATGPNLTVGGTAVSARNIISNNDNGNVWVSGASATGARILGNYIGTDVSGTAGFRNNAPGITVTDAPDVTIGGTAAGAGNLISGHNYNDSRPEVGVYVTGAGSTGTVIAGNYIGTTANGNGRIPNNEGIRIEGAPGVTIGGTVAGARNVISGNEGMGVYIIGAGASGTSVIGNYIGTNAAGTGNGTNFNFLSVLISGTPNVTVGGTTAAARNVIVGGGYGVNVFGATATGVTISGNYIGASAAGVALPFTGNGVWVGSGAAVMVGGTAPGAGNLIVGDPSSAPWRGVAVVQNSRVTILGNSVYAHNGIGIDLGENGVTLNDVGDGDTGPNGFQNFPTVVSASSGGGTSHIVTELTGVPNAAYTIELFNSPTCHATGYGEGQTFLGRATVQANSAGAVAHTLDVAALAVGSFVTATATDAQGNTSEFSACRAVQSSVQSCSPRPQVHVQSTIQSGLLLVTLTTSPLNTAAANPITELRFGVLQNATVSVNGQPVASNQTVSVGGGATSVQLIVDRVTPGLHTNVPLRVVDACGEWSTFVGGGPNAGF